MIVNGPAVDSGRRHLRGRRNGYDRAQNSRNKQLFRVHGLLLQLISLFGGFDRISSNRFFFPISSGKKRECGAKPDINPADFHKPLTINILRSIFLDDITPH
jgi:hypothetical protein